MPLLIDFADEHKTHPKPSEIRPACAPQLEAIRLRMMSKRVAGRYGSMKEVATTWTGYLKSGQTAADVRPQSAAPASSSPAPVIAGDTDLPADAPPPAVAPFTTQQATQFQEAWATYLKVPVEYTNALGMKFRLIPPGEFSSAGRTIRRVPG